MTKGQISDIIAKECIKYHVKHLGFGPKETRVYIIEDMIVVRFKGKLMPMEEKLLTSEGGVGLVKNIRKSLHEMMIGELSELITSITDQKVISAHGDISTRTGERIDIFILDKNYEALLTPSQSR